jgi:hypothetical protein
MLPKCFPPVSTVRGYFYAWRDSGLLATINHLLVMAAREQAGREASPSAGVIDSQSVTGIELWREREGERQASSSRRTVAMRLLHRWLQWFGAGLKGRVWLSDTCRVVQGPAACRVGRSFARARHRGRLAKAIRMRLAVVSQFEFGQHRLSPSGPAAYMLSAKHGGCMADRLTEILVKHREDLISSLDMMRRGILRTHHNGSDTTKETVAQYIGWVGDLTAAIKGHEAPMPKGPNGEKRPADAIGLAVMIGRIATGEIEDSREDVSNAAAQMGKLGGKARAASMTPERRSEIAKDAAAKRWRQ